MISTKRVLELIAKKDRDFAVERNNWIAERQSLIDQAHRERAELLNRIKPEAAQGVPMAGELHMPEAANMEVDESYWGEDLTALAEEVLAAGIAE